MILIRVSVVAVLLSLMVVVGYGQNSPANRPWPPGVQQAGEQSPALSPADALKSFYMPPGYHLELVASEPLVQNPTVIDQAGIWVTEMTGFVRDSAPERISRLVESSCSKTRIATGGRTSEPCSRTS
jgi:hypothetical protein